VADTLAVQRQLWELQQNGERSARHVETLERSLLEMRQAEWLRHENAEFDKLVAEADADLKEFNLPPGFARDWILARSLEDAGLRAAWDDCSANPITWRNAQGRLMVELNRAASNRIDPDLSADRFAVVQAMRHTAREMPPEREPDLGGLDNTEYRRHIRQKYGFDPGV
jgi:hypothetical protein